MSDAQGYREYTKFHSGFFAFLGSIVGASTMRILVDYKEEIGFRIVGKVVAFVEKEFEPFHAEQSNQDILARGVSPIVQKAEQAVDTPSKEFPSLK